MGIHRWLGGTTAGLAVAAVLTGCGNINYVLNKVYMDEIAKHPHTAHILNYAVTFPRAAELQDVFPGGLESGGPDLSYGQDEGQDWYSAQWDMAQGGGEIDFYVVDKIAAGKAPDDNRIPYGFSNMNFKDAGFVDAAGLKFKKVLWTGDFDDAVTHAKAVPGATYEARDESGKLIGLRGIYLGSAHGAEVITERVLKSLKRLPVKLRNETGPDGKPVSQPYGVIEP